MATADGGDEGLVLPAIPAVRKPSVQGRRYRGRRRPLKHLRDGVALPDDLLDTEDPEPVPLIPPAAQHQHNGLPTTKQAAAAQPDRPLPKPTPTTTRPAPTFHISDDKKVQLAKAAKDFFALARDAVGADSNVALTLAVDDVVLWAAKAAGRGGAAPAPDAELPRTASGRGVHTPAPPQAAAGARLPSLHPPRPPAPQDPTPPQQSGGCTGGRTLQATRVVSASAGAGVGEAEKAVAVATPTSPLPPLGESGRLSSPPGAAFDMDTGEVRANTSKMYRQVVAHFKKEIEELKGALARVEAENRELVEGGAMFARVSHENTRLRSDLTTCRSSIKELVSLVALCNEKIQVLEADLTLEKEKASLPQKVDWEPLRNIFSEFVLANNRTDASILKEVVSRITTMKTLQVELSAKNQQMHQRVAELEEEAQRLTQANSFRIAVAEPEKATPKKDPLPAARVPPKRVNMPASESALFSTSWRS